MPGFFDVPALLASLSSLEICLAPVRELFLEGEYASAGPLSRTLGMCYWASWLCTHSSALILRFVSQNPLLTFPLSSEITGQERGEQARNERDAKKTMVSVTAWDYKLLCLFHL